MILRFWCIPSMTIPRLIDIHARKRKLSNFQWDFGVLTCPVPRVLTCPNRTFWQKTSPHHKQCKFRQNLHCPFLANYLTIAYASKSSALSIFIMLQNLIKDEVKNLLSMRKNDVLALNSSNLNFHPPYCRGRMVSIRWHFCIKMVALWCIVSEIRPGC